MMPEARPQQCHLTHTSLPAVAALLLLTAACAAPAQEHPVAADFDGVILLDQAFNEAERSFIDEAFSELSYATGESIYYVLQPSPDSTPWALRRETIVQCGDHDRAMGCTYYAEREIKIDMGAILPTPIPSDSEHLAESSFRHVVLHELVHALGLPTHLPQDPILSPTATLTPSEPCVSLPLLQALSQIRPLAATRPTCP